MNNKIFIILLIFAIGTVKCNSEIGDSNENINLDVEDVVVDHVEQILNSDKNSNNEPNPEEIVETVNKVKTNVENVLVEDIPKSKTNQPRMDPERPKSGKYIGEYLGNLDTGVVNDNYDWENLNNPVAPDVIPLHSKEGETIGVAPARLAKIRSEFLYWFFDKDMKTGRGDYVTDIHSSTLQVHKNFNFQLPFFGFRFNYTRVSVNGYLEFSDPPEHYTYPVIFPVKDWPKKNDPSFIGIFFSKCRIGKIHPYDQDQRDPGVYFRMERDLMTRVDRFGSEVRERVMWDIREGVVGADTFIPKHVVIVTWKNMSFAGGIGNSLYQTNTFQMVLATDEVYTYAIFNYADINWSSHTEAGGDTTKGEGGVPAFIGFNAGNGTQSYEYLPYSQASVLRDLSGRGWANGFPGRHIFRIDEKIMLGTCNKDIDASHLALVFAPESGNMLGGTVVNITGPCFNENERISCRFDTEEVVGHYINRNRAICVQPFLKAQGYIRFEISIGVDRYKWRGKYFVETPGTATDKIFFETTDVHLKNPPEFKITWNRQNLTTNLNAGVQISLYGYRESTIRPELEYIDMIETNVNNQGYYIISPNNYRNRDNRKHVDMQFGFLKINLTNPETYSGLPISPVLWSKPIPLAWYFGPQWERMHGKNWPKALCDNWFLSDRFLRNFAAEIPLCPCTLEHALLDKGRFLPDFECDKDSNPTCLHHKGAIHCVRSGTPSLQGSEQQCCYDRNGYLMLSYDQMWGSRPRRNHNVGQMPWNEANKVPTLSTWFHDVRPYYSCCKWQDEQAVGCETFRFERRPSQDCIAYQAPGVAGVFGDPHIVTFDNTQYTFNGMGEFVLLRGNNGQEKVDVQGRFEQIPRNVYGPVMATYLTSVAARGNTSTIIEVRLRPKDAQWRYRLDVFADGRRIYFDRQSLKFQYFHGVTVYTPTYILNQSEVVIMFSSGVGVEVVENAGFMTARVYAPWSFINKTSGLFGNWSYNPQDDFVLPDGTVTGVNLNNFESMHRDFAMKWMLSDREQPGVGAGLFTREFGRTASYFANATFLPNFIKEPRDFLPPNRTHDIIKAEELCGESYQCRYDYGMSLSRDMAHFTRNYYDSVTNIRATNQKRIISCGILETPRFGMKSNFLFVPGSRVSFQCNEGFVLRGDARRVCTAEGKWDVPEYGYTECLRDVFYYRQTAWIATGIILAVIIPILLCIVCGAYYYRKYQKKQDPDWKMPIPSRSNSRTTLRNQSDDSELLDGNKRRSYEKVYRTNEPLDGKPNVEFPKKWDDDDVISSEGSDFKDSKLAKDIEYMSNEERPKQTGRRSLHITDPNAGDLNAGPSNYPEPISPLSSTYSPTYSGADRNSFGNNSNKNLPGGIRVLPGTVNLIDEDNESYKKSPPMVIKQDANLARANSRSTEV